jgi:ParB-like chromosome segregation protein Spo0J
MDVIDLPLGQIIPYARNPRKNEKAVATVAASIAEFGWRQPIVVDERHVVPAGRRPRQPHHRRAALRPRECPPGGASVLVTG